MSDTFLHRNQLVAVKGELARVLNLLQDRKTWQLETVHDQVVHRYQDAELRRLYVDGLVDLDPVRDDTIGQAVAEKQSRAFEAYGDAQRAEAKRRLHYVKAALAADWKTLIDADLAKVIGAAAIENGDQGRPRPETVRKWVAFYLSGRHDIRALIPCWHRRGNRVRRQYLQREGRRISIPAQESEEVLGVALREYLRRERPRGTTCFRFVKSYFARENERRSVSNQLTPPSRSTVFRRLAAMDPYEKAYFRYGKARADELLKLKGDGPGASFPLERVEMDATRLDVFVVAPGSGLMIGRPWITVAIDYFSRAIIGFYLGFEPPSAIAVMHCLRHAIGPKDRYIEKLEFKEEAFSWPMHGIPLLIVVDNAREYQSETMEDAALQLGFDVQQHPVKWPHWKGTIERFFRTLNEGALAWVPGRSFRNVIEKGDYDAASVAILELPDLERLIAKWIILEYNNTRHEGISDVPARLWDEGVKKALPTLPPRMADLDVLLSYTRTMTLTNQGIQFQNLKYRSEDAHAILMRAGRSIPVKVKVDDRDISVIRILDPKIGRYIPVPVQGKHAEYAKGLSLAEHIAVQRYRRIIADQAENRPELIDARNQLAQEMADLLGNKRATSRDKMRAARVNAQRLLDSRAVRGAFDPFKDERTISKALRAEVEGNEDETSFEHGSAEGEMAAGDERRVGSGEESSAEHPARPADPDPDGYGNFRESEKITVRKRPKR